MSTVFTINRVCLERSELELVLQQKSVVCVESITTNIILGRPKFVQALLTNFLRHQYVLIVLSEHPYF